MEKSNVEQKRANHTKNRYENSDQNPHDVAPTNGRMEKYGTMLFPGDAKSNHDPEAIQKNTGRGFGG